MYESRQITDKEYKTLVSTIRDGYTDNDGIRHKPNEQVADILVLEANLGCRINDIISLRTDSFVLDNDIWKIKIIEQKTKKRRVFVIPKQIKKYIDTIIDKGYSDTVKLFSISAAAVWKSLRICTATLGMENVSSHSFRKLAAMNLYKATDYNVELVSQWLNHSSVVITRHYLGISSKEMENALSKTVNLA